MFADPLRRTVWDDLRQQDIRAFARWLTPATFTAAAARAALRISCSPLSVVNLVWLALAVALHPTQTFADVLTATLKILQDHQAFATSTFGRAQRHARRRAGARRCKHDPRRADPTQVSEEAFAQARQRFPQELWLALLSVLLEQFEAEHAERLRLYGFRILALDGSCLDLAASPANRRHFGTARNARGDHGPQARMTLLQFPLTRLPYRYELGPLATGEVTMAGRLVQALRPDDLVLLDAGFWSYGLFWQIQQRQAFFAIRLRRGPLLKTVRRLGRYDTSVRWAPKDSRGQWRKQGLPRSLDLRVLRYCVPGFRATAIVTNVLAPERLAREDWVRLTSAADAEGRLLPGLYHRRLEIETTWRELKVEQGMEPLRSRTPASVAFEVGGHVLLYVLVRWLIVAATAAGQDPLRLSFVAALRELAAMRVALLYASPRWAATVLVPRLLARIASHVVPYRPGRHYPRRKPKPKPSKRRNKHPQAKTKPRRGAGSRANQKAQA